MVKPRLMSNEAFTRIVDVLAREGFQRVYTYLSGEPFMHPDIYEFIAEVAEHGMSSSTATKLSVPIDFDRLDRALARADAAEGKAQFLVTVDSFRQETLRRIAPGISLDRVESELTECAELRERHKSATFVFDTVVNRYNEGELDEIRSTLAELGFTSWYPKQMGYYHSRFANDEDVSTIADAVPENVEYRARFEVADNEIVCRKESCRIGACVIGPEGEDTLCCHDMLYELNFGNVLKEGSLRRIMASRAFREAFAAGRKMKLEICKGCN